MPLGTGVELFRNLPQQEFISDPTAFMAMTRKAVLPSRSAPAPGAGGFADVELPAAGLVSKLQIIFVGQAVVSTAAVTTGDEWPYNLLKGFNLSVNGQSNLWSCDGCDLHALRFVRYPAFEDMVDNFPGSVGGGDSVGTGTHPLHLTWEVPLAMDDTTLVGSLYAQSAASQLSARLTQATNAELFSANPANAAITGTFYVLETLFAIPIDAQGRIVIPDLSRMHAFNAVVTPYTAVGENRAELIRSAGQLARLFVSGRASATNRLSADPSAAATKKINELRLEYGAGERPLVYDPAASLLATNNQHYGAPAPYDRLVIDAVRENPVRDAINLQGLTELATILEVGAGVTVSAGTIRAVQETLF